MFYLDSLVHTERLLLRPFVADDFGDVFAYYSNPDVTRYLYWDARDEKETRKALEQKSKDAHLSREGDVLCLAVVLKDSQKLIGEVTLFWRSKEHQQGEIGFIFNPEFSGRGYATEASNALLKVGFETLKLHRIYGRCEARNVASYKLMERLNMRREAHLIHNELFKGEWSDELIYALLRTEWEERSTSTGTTRVTAVGDSELL